MWTFRCEEKQEGEQVFRARMLITSEQGEIVLPWSEALLGKQNAKHAAAKIALRYMQLESCTASPTRASPAAPLPRRLHHQCPITGLPINDKLATKLQSSAQVTATTLRNALHNSLGWPLRTISEHWSKDTLIIQYYAALTDRPPASISPNAGGVKHSPASDSDSIELVDPGLGKDAGPSGVGEGHSRVAPAKEESRKVVATLSDSESDVDDLTKSGGATSKSQVRKFDRGSGNDTIEPVLLLQGGGGGQGAGRGKAYRDGDVLIVEDLSPWRRLERKRQMEQEKTKTEADRALPLWQRLESRRKHELHDDDEQLEKSESAEEDIFGVATGSSAPGGTSGHATVAGKLSKVDKVLISHVCAVGNMASKIEEEVVRLERERDESVRRQTAHAVKALDFERAALVKHTIHAEFQRKISAVQTAGRERRSSKVGHDDTTCTSHDSAAARVQDETSQAPLRADAEPTPVREMAWSGYCPQKKKAQQVAAYLAMQHLLNPASSSGEEGMLEAPLRDDAKSWPSALREHLVSTYDQAAAEEMLEFQTHEREKTFSARVVLKSRSKH